MRPAGDAGAAPAFDATTMFGQQAAPEPEPQPQPQPQPQPAASAPAAGARRTGTSWQEQADAAPSALKWILQDALRLTVPTDLAGTIDKNEEAPAAGDLSRTVTHRVASRPKNYAVARMRRSERVVLGWHSASSPWAGNMDGTLAPEEEAQIVEKLAHERHFDAILFFMFFFGYESSISAHGWGKWYLLAAVAAASVGVTIWMDESCNGVNTPRFNATVCRAVDLSLYTNYTAAKFACENAAQLGRCNYVPDTSYLWALYRRDLYMVLCAALSVPCFLFLTFLDMWVRDGVRTSPVGRSIARTKKSLSNRLLPGVTEDSDMGEPLSAQGSASNHDQHE